jgi:hypothetical protein
MRQQYRESQTTRPTEVTLNPLFQRLFGIGIALVTSMAVDCPRTTAGTHRTNSSELIFAKLNRRRSPKSSRAIKPLYLGHNDSTPMNLCLTVQSHAPPSIHSATPISPASAGSLGSGGKACPSSRSPRGTELLARIACGGNCTLPCFSSRRNTTLAELMHSRPLASLQLSARQKSSINS